MFPPEKAPANAKREFVSYAHKDLPAKKVRKYASQYDGVDMATLMGADEDNFPLLLKAADGEFEVCWWNSSSGFMTAIDEDAVRSYATLTYLINHAYPRFDSLEDAENWAKTHNWPRKRLGREDPDK